MTREITECLGLDKPKGALVASVSEGSPAKRGGIRRGDVILDVNGKFVSAMHDLPRLTASIKAGEVAEIEILRARKETALKVRIGATP